MINPQPISLVLISGFMLDETLWDDFCPLLPNHWKGSRTILTRGNTIKEIAQHIAEQSPEHFVLIDFSLGGYVAKQLAADYPERVSALGLVASSLREDTEQQAKAKLEAVHALSTSTFNGLSSRSIAASLNYPLPFASQPEAHALKINAPHSIIYNSSPTCTFVTA